MAMQCPYCNSTDVKTKLTGNMSWFGCAGIGATLGAITGGTLGMATGSFLGSLISDSVAKLYLHIPTDTRGRQSGIYKCKYCKKTFLTCPRCNRELRITNINNDNNNIVCEYCNNEITFIYD